MQWNPFLLERIPPQMVGQGLIQLAAGATTIQFFKSKPLTFSEQIDGPGQSTIN